MIFLMQGDIFDIKQFYYERFKLLNVLSLLLALGFWGRRPVSWVLGSWGPGSKGPGSWVLILDYAIKNMIILFYLLKGATKLYFKHYPCLVIILLKRVYESLHFTPILLEN